MRGRLSKLERRGGPRPRMTLIIDDGFVREIWVNGRAPLITLHDYDWGATDPDPAFDAEGFAFSPINWRGPAWTLGLSLHPPAKETYTMANQKMKSIAITDLKVSKLNMRHARKHPDVSDLVPSIRAHGLRQSLLVRQEGKHYGVVAGRRRLFALKQISKDTGTNMKVPCIVMRAGEDAEAIEASILENVARLPATEIEQFSAFGRLADEGRTVTEIANYFGITELTVRRVLALANLTKPIRDLYANDEIDRATVHALTLATSTQQAEWLKLYHDENEHELRGRNCKAWVTGGATISTDKALFDLVDYEGEIVTDLFGEVGVFANSEAFWAAQSNALAARIEAYLEKGWSDVCVLERGQYFQSWDNQKRARTKGGKVFVEVRHDGTITFHEGLISNAEARKLDRTANGQKDKIAVARPEMTKAMADYLSEHRRLATAATLQSKPKIAMRLAVAHMLVGSSLWQLRRHQVRVKSEAIIESLNQSHAASEVEEMRELVCQMLSAHGIGSPRHNGDTYHLCQVFAALLGMSDDEVLTILTSAMVQSLEAGTAIVEAIAVATDTDMSGYWKPDEVFFDLLKDKRAINAMISDIATPSVAKNCLTDTAKVQKEVLVNKITGEGDKANLDWRPVWMQVPPGRLIEGAPSVPFDQWQRVESMFCEKETEDQSPESEGAVAA